MPSDPIESNRLRWLLVLGGLLIGLGLAEVGFRFMKPLGPEFVLAATTQSINNSFFRDDVELRVVLAPDVNANGFKTNALGLRGDALSAKRADESRILAIGDSFTLGLAVDDDETFAARLDASLGETVTVMNAGVPGYGTEQSIALMRRLVPQTSADAVLLTIYTGNDLRDNVRWSKSPGMPTRPPTVVEPPPPERSAILKGLARYSRAVSYVLMWIDLDKAESDFRIAEFKDEILPFAGRDNLKPLMPPTRSALQRFSDACRDLRVRCGVALVPPAYVVHTERLARTFEAFGLDPATADIDLPQQYVKAAVPHPMPVIDLTTSLREDSDRGPYLVFDPHFSAEGHSTAAEALKPFVHKLLGLN